MKLVKNGIKMGLVSAVVFGGIALVTGPERVSALLSQTQDSFNDKIDEHIQEPIALKQQINDLKKQYPKKIKKVQEELHEVNNQIARLKKERSVSERVVEMAKRDINELETRLAHADSSHGIVKVSFNKKTLTHDDAQNRLERIKQIKTNHGAKVNSIDKNLRYLETQQTRLAEIYDELQSEYQKLQNRVMNLRQEVATIERNEELIKILKERQKTIEEFENSYATPGSLGQMESRISQIRSRQESTLQNLFSSPESYEQRARESLSIEPTSSNNNQQKPNESDNYIGPRRDQDQIAKGDG